MIDSISYYFPTRIYTPHIYAHIICHAASAQCYMYKHIIQEQASGCLTLLALSLFLSRSLSNHCRSASLLKPIAARPPARGPIKNYSIAAVNPTLGNAVAHKSTLIGTPLVFFSCSAGLRLGGTLALSFSLMAKA